MSPVVFRTDAVGLIVERRDAHGVRRHGEEIGVPEHLVEDHRVGEGQLEIRPHRQSLRRSRRTRRWTGRSSCRASPGIAAGIPAILRPSAATIRLHNAPTRAVSGQPSHTHRLWAHPAADSLRVLKIEVPAWLRVPVLGDAVEVAPAVRKKAAGPVVIRSEQRLQVAHVLGARLALSGSCPPAFCPRRSG